MFTDWNEFPADDETNLVEPDTESYHSIHATYTYCSDDVKVLPAWSRKCYFSDEYPLRFFRSYHDSDCDHMCFVRAVEKFCQCLPAYVPNVYQSQVCNVTSIPCMMEVKLQLGKWMYSKECDCPRDCESLRFKVDMSIGNLNALPYVLNNPYSGLIINKSTSIMHFFVTNSGYVKQRQETVMSLISLACK
ncbi:sodium channel protein Nach [Manduca sexta]|uniref:sodium channel protein Nach n=1 Tax=Manduca sexta TaxID=7130 RepID=UPI00188E4534|nr:sodium channel protein Nach [Manduca sexta]